MADDTITLWDHYAGHALQGMLAGGFLEKMWAPNEETEDPGNDPARILEVRRELCRRAFLLADDMMIVRLQRIAESEKEH